jgi:hypothetical protein
MSKDTEVVAYKGFDQNFQCRGFQFEVGKTYEHDGNVEVCKRGFHACEYPLDVFIYYPPATSRFAEVKQSRKLRRHDGDTKIASAKITIGVELQLHDIIQRAVQWVFDHAKPENTEHATAVGGVASATGVGGVASATGGRGVASAMGYEGVASATGVGGVASATGVGGVASATGDRGVASATGFRGVASATGVGGVASATGGRGVASATGVGGVASTTGVGGVASATGVGSRVKGANGCALFLVYRSPDNGEILHAWAGIVGRDGIEPDVWYELDNGGSPQRCTVESA